MLVWVREQVPKIGVQRLKERFLIDYILYSIVYVSRTGTILGVITSIYLSSRLEKVELESCSVRTCTLTTPSLTLGCKVGKVVVREEEEGEGCGDVGVESGSGRWGEGGEEGIILGPNDRNGNSMGRPRNWEIVQVGEALEGEKEGEGRAGGGGLRNCETEEEGNTQRCCN
ncbi:hypothetical protein BDZ91DRAFT_767889 [Kalaharituber pfeilii]|nr:hypothetical protein BDZ91DRAFT_767889 [Kalaharituber pfeilii]